MVLSKAVGSTEASLGRTVLAMAEREKSPEHLEPSAESLAEMPEIDLSKHRSRPGRGHYAHLRGRDVVEVDPDQAAKGS